MSKHHVSLRCGGCLADAGHRGHCLLLRLWSAASRSRRRRNRDAVLRRGKVVTRHRGQLRTMGWLWTPGVVVVLLERSNHLRKPRRAEDAVHRGRTRSWDRRQGDQELTSNRTAVVVAPDQASPLRASGRRVRRLVVTGERDKGTRHRRARRRRRYPSETHQTRRQGRQTRTRSRRRRRRPTLGLTRCPSKTCEGTSGRAMSTCCAQHRRPITPQHVERSPGDSNTGPRELKSKRYFPQLLPGAHQVHDGLPGVPSLK